jgi:hypothetical protein
MKHSSLSPPGKNNSYKLWAYLETDRIRLGPISKNFFASVVNGNVNMCVKYAGKVLHLRANIKKFFNVVTYEYS